MTSYTLPVPNLIQETTAIQRKLCVQHSTIATQIIKGPLDI